MRFVLNEPLTNGVTRSFENSGDAENDALASALFAIDNVINVYYVINTLPLLKMVKQFGLSFSES